MVFSPMGMIFFCFRINCVSKLNIYIPKTKFGGIKELPCLFVRTSVWAKFVSGLYLSYGKPYFTQRLLINWGCVMTLTKGQSVKVTGRKSEIFVPGPYLMVKHWKFLLQQRLLITWGFVLILTQGHLGKVIGRISAKLVSGLYLFYG